MGTRGAIVLVADEQEKVIYNHYDSYPNGLGEDVLNWLRSSLDTEQETRAAVIALRPVPKGDPAPEDIERHAETHDPNASTGTDWYSLLRHTQGDLAATLRAGLYEPADSFPLDSLFCEWAYVVDFDTRVFEVYRGFQQQPPAAGRWVERDAPENGYHAVDRVIFWKFDELPESVAAELAGEGD